MKKNYSKAQLREMRDEELYELSLQKDKQGHYTAVATRAYEVRQERADPSGWRDLREQQIEEEREVRAKHQS